MMSPTLSLSFSCNVRARKWFWPFQFSRTRTCCIHILASPNAKSRDTFSLSLSLSKRRSLGFLSSPTETTLRHLITPISALNSGLEASITDSNDISAILTNVKIVVDSEDENKIQLRVDLTGDQTQKVFDRILINLGHDAPPVPGFRMQKGDPKGLPCADSWEERVTKFAIQEILNSTMALHCFEFYFMQERSLAPPAVAQDESIARISVTNDHILSDNAPVLQQNDLPPLVSALKASVEQNAASFHFPGHNRGHAAPASLTRLIGTRPYVHDLPELPEFDNLFCPQGPILEAQTEAAKLFGSSQTWFLVGGTTYGIQAAIMATCSPGEFLILPRNSHISAISAMVLSGAVPKYIIPDYENDWDIAGGVTPLQVLKAIQELEMEGKEEQQCSSLHLLIMVFAVT